jgi:glycosyltransferase involved in cell wall biosynthesis
MTPSISVILPVYNEEGAIRSVYEVLKKEIASLDHEIIFVNDGSSDQTPEILNSLAESDFAAKVIHFGRNYGQTAAMSAGIDAATKDIIIAMDADGQNDPKDIYALLNKINEGFDVVSGWRQNRQDKAFSRKLPSHLANWIISKVSGVTLQDYGCSLKAYKRHVIQDVRLYGEMHRFIPIYTKWFGAKVTEIPVSHHARTTGQSKYGINRTFKVILDLLVVKFLQSYLSKPIYIIGGFGLILLGLSGLGFLVATYLKFVKNISYVQTPLPIFSATSFMMGIMSILLGIVSEILMRTYYESQQKKPYYIQSTVNL